MVNQLQRAVVAVAVGLVHFSIKYSTGIVLRELYYRKYRESEGHQSGVQVGQRKC